MVQRVVVAVLHDFSSQPRSMLSDLAGFPLCMDMERLCSGHQVPMSWTNTLNACSWPHGTSIAVTNGSSIFRLRLRLAVFYLTGDFSAVRGQRIRPESLQVATQLVEAIAPHPVQPM